MKGRLELAVPVKKKKKWLDPICSLNPVWLSHQFASRRWTRSPFQVLIQTHGNFSLRSQQRCFVLLTYPWGFLCIHLELIHSVLWHAGDDKICPGGSVFTFVCWGNLEGKEKEKPAISSGIMALKIQNWSSSCGGPYIPKCFTHFTIIGCNRALSVLNGPDSCNVSFTVFILRSLTTFKAFKRSDYIQSRVSWRSTSEWPWSDLFGWA